jgi:hypothetical protein
VPSNQKVKYLKLFTNGKIFLHLLMITDWMIIHGIRPKMKNLLSDTASCRTTRKIAPDAPEAA